MQPTAEGDLNPEAQPPSQEVLKSIFDLTSTIGRRGIRFERLYYQSGGIIKDGRIILFTVPGPEQRELTPNELKVDIDIMTLGSDKLNFDILSYNVIRKKQGKKQTFTIERHEKTENLEAGKKYLKKARKAGKSERRAKRFWEMSEERISQENERKQRDIEAGISFVSNDEANKLETLLKDIKDNGFVADITRQMKEMGL